MNNYEAKQVARRARLEEKARAARGESARVYRSAKSMSDSIPFGQPILIGHHSEGRDRNYRNRIHNTYGKAFALDSKADHYENKAASVGRGGISSDDPEAITKLRDQLENLETLQKQMKSTNALIRKNDCAALAKLGMTPEQIEALFKPDFCGRVGFASYQLTNNNANMRRIKERITILDEASKQKNCEIQGNGFTVREDVAENRVMVFFSTKPVKEICRLVSSNGFKWSPTRTAWVRQLNNAGRYAAKFLIEELAKNPLYGNN